MPACFLATCGRGKETFCHGMRAGNAICRCAARTETWSLKPTKPEQRRRKKRDATMRVGAGNVELVKCGAARYDFSDPYHIAIELSWKGFALARDRLAELLSEDLAREYQAIIAYVVYSQVLTGAQFMDIAAQLEIHAKQELDHAMILSRQIDYLGKMPVVTPKPVRTSKNPEDMLRYDLDNENETISNYRDRIRQCEALGEYAMAGQIRQILMQEQDHQIDLATALGEEVPDVGGGPKARTLLKRR